MNKFIGKFLLGVFVISLFSIGSSVLAGEACDDKEIPQYPGEEALFWDCVRDSYDEEDSCHKAGGEWKYPDYLATLCYGTNTCLLCTKTTPIETPVAEEKAAADAADAAAAASKVKCDNGTVIGGTICQCPDNTKNIDGVCESCDTDGVCCGIELNTNVPFIGNCIELSKTDSVSSDNDETKVTDATAFPVLMGGLTKMMVTIILLISFIGILAGGVMIASSGGSDDGARKGKAIIGKVIIGLALLGASGVILRLINPTFFG